jgi:TetR/AcrR family transcriptional repressor of nem operon
MYLSVVFQDTIERGIRSGELGNDANAKVLAQTLVVSMIGLTVLMKSRPDRTLADNAVATILALIKYVFRIID